jgi:hypothetical protein
VQFTRHPRRRGLASVPRQATAATIRAQPIAVPARLARSARWLGPHLRGNWPRQAAWVQLFGATWGSPAAVRSRPPRAIRPNRR